MREQEAGSRDEGAGSRKQGAWMREQGATGVNTTIHQLMNTICLFDAFKRFLFHTFSLKFSNNDLKISWLQ